MEDTKKSGESGTKVVPSVQVYLAQQGVDEYTPSAEVEAHKRAHRRLYHQAYHEERKATQKRLAHRLSKEEHTRLKRHAKAHGQEKLSPFMKACAFAYLEKRYLERHPQQTEELIKEVRKIGSNINQVVQVMHTVRAYSEAEKYQRIRDEVNDLVGVVKKQLREPPNLRTYIETIIAEQPHLLTSFEQMLWDMKQQYGNEKQDAQG